MAVAGADLVAEARRHIGKPYVWAATGPNAFDCSGLMVYVARKFGLSIPRVTYDQVKSGSAVPSLAMAQPGDLVFTTWSGDRNGHVGMYAGNNKIVHSSTGGVKEITVTPSYATHISAIRRIPGVAGGGGVLSGIGGTIGLRERDIGGGNPVDPTGLVDDVQDAIRDLAISAGKASALADLLVKLFLPNNLMRGALLFAGAMFILIGLFFVAREVKNG